MTQITFDPKKGKVTIELDLSMTNLEGGIPSKSAKTYVLATGGGSGIMPVNGKSFPFKFSATVYVDKNVADCIMGRE